MMRMVLLPVLGILCSLVVPLEAAWAETPASTATGWNLLKQGGRVALIRHAMAPGVGDPPQFNIEDCATQRNLSQQGRSQASKLGEAFRKHRIPIERVLSSRWCRCLETARLAFGQAEPFDALNSFFRHPERETIQTQTMRQFIKSWKVAHSNLVLVTHQVNITALVEVYPSQGEIIVARPQPDGSLVVEARLMPTAESAQSAAP